MPRKSRLDLPPLNLGEETIGQRLARLRKQRGQTQTELAEKIGILQNMVSAYERDSLRLHADMLARFALALGVSSDEILGLSLRLEESEEATSNPSPRLVKRMKKIARLPATEQKALLKTIDVFIKGAEVD